MANVKDIHRLLGSRGASLIGLDTVTRKLKAEGLIPAEGRGPYARDLTSEEAATILIAFLGSGKATSAAKRLAILGNLVAARGRVTLLDRLSSELEQPNAEREIDHIRVSRTAAWASFHYSDGTEECFESRERVEALPAMRSEGIVEGSVLKDLALLLRSPGAARRKMKKLKGKRHGK